MSGQDIYEAIDLVKDKYIDEVYNSQNKNNASLSKKKLYILLLAATMVIATLTACAAEVYKWDGRLSQVLNLSAEQKTYVDGMWYSINETKTVNGITVTLDSVLADNNSMLLLYDVTLPKSMDMDRYYNFEINQIDAQDWFSFVGSMGDSTFKTSSIEVDKKNHTITYLMEYSASSGSLKEQKMRFWFNDLHSYKIIDNAIADERLEQEVDFVFYSDIAYTPNVLNYSLDEQLSGLLNTVKVENITITPISLTIKASGERKFILWNIETNEHEKEFVSAVILKDGTKVELSNSSTGASNKTVSYKTMFKDIINPKDIAAIEFFETERVSLANLQYTTEVESILSTSQIAKIIFEISIFISLISMVVSAISTLHFCKSDIYKYFEKIQSKKQKKGKQYTLDEFCFSYKKKMMIVEIIYIYFSIILFLGVCRLTFLIISNWFVTMTVFMDALCIGLIFLMIATIRESRKKRKCLEKI